MVPEKLRHRYIILLTLFLLMRNNYTFLKLIQNQIDTRHPLWDYIKDKGGDIAVSGITTYGPIIWSAIKAYLLSQGISFQ